MKYTILAQQKCASSSCIDNEELLRSKNIFLTPHFSDLKKIIKVLKVHPKYITSNIKSSNPFKNNIASLKLEKDSKTIAIIREPIDLLLSHYNQLPNGCMNIRKSDFKFGFKNVTSFLKNVKEQHTFHPTLISTHYPLYDYNFRLLKIDYLLHIKNLDKFLKDNDIIIPSRVKETPLIDKKRQKAQLKEIIKMVDDYYQFEKDLSEVVKKQTLFKVKDIPNHFNYLPEERIEILIKNMSK